MSEFFSQIINGLAIGNVYALLAIGFALVFGVANLINFAQGSLFMFGAYLTFTGASLLGLPLILAALLAIALTTLLGLIIDSGFLRPLQKGPLIAPLLATLAVAIILDELAHIIWSPQTQAFPSPLAGHVWNIGNAYISMVDVLILAVGVASITALTLFITKTWTGRALRATAADPEVAQQMGVNVAAIRSLTFGLAGALGGIGGVLVGMYYQSIFPTMGLPFGLKGFTAALLGGITSIPGAIAGGMLLGVFESLASGYIGSTYRNMVAYILLLVVLFFRPQGLFGKRDLEGLGGSQAAAGAIPTTSLMASSFGGAKAGAFHLRGWPLLLLAGITAIFPMWAPNAYWLQVGTIGLIFALLAVSLTLVSGTAGQISIGHAALFGVGAYTTAILSRSFGLPTEIILLTAGLMGMLAGVLSGLPAVRLSGHVIVMATLASGLIFYSIFLTWLPVTRGPMGIPGIPSPKLALLGGLELSHVGHHYWLALSVLALSLLVVAKLLRSNIGRTWRAIREDRLAAAASGVFVVRYLLMAFAVSGFIAGMSGGLYAYLLTFIGPISFYILTSIIVLTMVVLGGLGNLTGAVFGAVLLIILPEAFRGLEDYRMIAYGVILLLAIMFRPHGLMGSD